MKLKIAIIGDSPGWSCATVMRNVAKHSKHELTCYFWGIPNEDINRYDIVYVHYGGILRGGSKLVDQMRKYRNVKWIGGLRGMTNYGRWIFQRKIHKFVLELDAISSANELFKRLVHNINPDLNIFVCHSGVDTSIFKPSPLPEKFSIGWAGNSGSGAKRYGDFAQLPFFKLTAAVRKGTSRNFGQMHKYYPTISLYVSTSSSEGSPLPPKEAAASGRPVVATGVGDLLEWVPPEFLVPWNPRLRTTNYLKLIPLIQKFKDDSELLKRECERFRRLVLRFDFKNITKNEYDPMFEAVMKK